MLVQIFVGAERKKYSAHKNLICKSGDFFRDVFQDNGKGAENKMDLPEDNPYIFDALASWMYTKHLGGLPSVDEESDIPIIELYIFADKY
ncbi:hypothetical protein ACHAO1_002679 [Botrytis cinerea]